MSNHTFELGLTPPPGVAFVQWGDGSIRIRYATKDVVPIRTMLLNLARSLTEQAIVKLQTERAAEIAKQRMPLTRLQTINEEMANLQKEMNGTELETIDLSLFEQAITAGIASVEQPPTIVVGKVVPEFED